MAAVVGLALAFRLAALDARPMHHDEANQAIRFGHLLETGAYRYDATEHHGPTLYYLTLPAAWLRGQATTAALDERTVRVVPALFGVGAVLLLLALRRDIGRAATVFAAGLLAVAPALTYYSRFYIQESLFLCFTLGFLVTAGRYTLSGRPAWAWWAGACAGLAIATKETAVIVLPAALAACWVGRRWTRGVEGGDADGTSTEGTVAPPGAPPRGRGTALPVLAAEHVWAAAAVALAVAALFYSSFFTNLPGLVEPFRAVSVYFDRGLNPEAHREPWHYYLRLLFESSGGRGATDVGLLTLVFAGAMLALRAPSSADRIAFWAWCLLVYAVVTTAAFSALAYKTPWNALPFCAPWLMLAAVGAAEPFRRTVSLAGRIVFTLAVVFVCITLGQQSRRLNFLYPADPRNPYAYVHTSPDVVRLAARVTALAAFHPDRERMLVAVVAGPYEQWPLPWYFRRLPRVGYWTTPASAGSALEQAPVVIASPEHAAGVQAAIGDRRQLELYGLRPDVLLSVFVERSLWDRFIESVK